MYYVTKEKLTAKSENNTSLLDMIFGATIIQDDKKIQYLTTNDEDEENSDTTIKFIQKQKRLIDFTIRNEQHSTLINILNNEMKSFLASNDPNNSYTTFRIPKSSGGFREINAPSEELKLLQRNVLYQLQNNFKIYTTQWAYAYITKRNCLDLAKIHEQNNYIFKADIHNFFPSLTTEIVKKQLLKIYQFNIINEQCPEFIDNLLKISALNGVLPQGSPLSPYLSNLCMIDFDYHTFKTVIKVGYKYTRYADDLILSSQKHIYEKATKELIDEYLSNYLDPSIQLNPKKTKQLSIKTNKTYIVGIKLNKDHQLTFGHEKKRQLKLDLFNMFINYKNQTLTETEAREKLGLFSYMKQIEPDYADYLERKLLKRFKSNAPTLFKHFKF